MGVTTLKALMLFILAAVLLVGTVHVSCAEDTPEKPFIAKPFMKFARGAVNMVSAPLELPNQMYLLSDYASENSPYGIETASAAIEGLFTGVAYTLWRFVAGAYDVITFPAPRYESCLISPPYLTSSYDAYYNKGEQAAAAEAESPEDTTLPSEPEAE